MFSDAPPCSEERMTSCTCLDLVLTKILVNSMINAPARTPQEMIPASDHQRLARGAPLASTKSPSNSLLAPKATMMARMQLVQTRSVSGDSQLKSFLPP